jgi:hypothetical protein
LFLAVTWRSQTQITYSRFIRWPQQGLALNYLNTLQPKETATQPQHPSQTSTQQSSSSSTTAPVDGLENKVEDLMGRIDARGKVVKKKST